MQSYLGCLTKVNFSSSLIISWVFYLHIIVSSSWWECFLVFLGTSGNCISRSLLIWVAPTQTNVHLSWGATSERSRLPAALNRNIQGWRPTRWNAQLCINISTVPTTPRIYSRIKPGRVQLEHRKIAEREPSKEIATQRPMMARSQSIQEQDEENALVCELVVDNFSLVHPRTIRKRAGKRNTATRHWARAQINR